MISGYSGGGSPLVGDGDRFGFGVEPEMKESGEKGGPDDVPIGGHFHGDTFDFQPQLTTEPTAPQAAGPTPPISEIVVTKISDVCSTPLLPSDTDTDGFVFTDYKPTESLRADDNFLVTDWLAEDHFKVDPSDPSVDPTNPNVEWPIGPIPEVQDDGLLLPY